MTLSTSDAQLPARVQAYIKAVVQTCAQRHAPLVSVVLFGSATSGGFSEDLSDVDVILVVRDESPRTTRRGAGEEIARLETVHGLRSATAEASRGLRAHIERAVGHGFSCFVCTRSDLISGDVARVLNLLPLETPFLDRIIFASIVASAVTVWGENLLPRIRVPSVRRVDVGKAFFAFSSQVCLSAMTFPVLPQATKYAMGALN
jgi:hypothetical protein